MKKNIMFLVMLSVLSVSLVGCGSKENISDDISPKPVTGECESGFDVCLSNSSYVTERNINSDRNDFIIESKALGYSISKDEHLINDNSAQGIILEAVKDDTTLKLEMYGDDELSDKFNYNSAEYSTLMHIKTPINDVFDISKTDYMALADWCGLESASTMSLSATPKVDVAKINSAVKNLLDKNSNGEWVDVPSDYDKWVSTRVCMENGYILVETYFL